MCDTVRVCQAYQHHVATWGQQASHLPSAPNPLLALPFNRPARRPLPRSAPRTCGGFHSSPPSAGRPNRAARCARFATSSSVNRSMPVAKPGRASRSFRASSRRSRRCPGSTYSMPNLSALPQGDAQGVPAGGQEVVGVRRGRGPSGRGEAAKGRAGSSGGGWWAALARRKRAHSALPSFVLQPLLLQPR